MPLGKARAAEGSARFSNFILYPLARRLEKDGVQIQLGGRALDILITLVDRAGEIVSHQELHAKVWQNVVVEAGSLRVQMRALRRALGDGEDGSSFIVNISGRGYCFVAPVIRTVAEPALLPADAETALPKPTPLVGRDQVMRNVIARLVETRFVTITGTGGVGKTAVAVGVAHALVSAFGGAVYFLDLSEVTSAHAAHVMLGRAALRRLVVAEGAVRGLAESLAGERILIILDCCDRIAGEMGELAATLVHETTHVHVLSTSRQRLGVAGEAVIALAPLSCPAEVDAVEVGALTDYPGVRLLTDLLRRQNHQAQATDAELRALARIAKQMDGLPLAIQLAAVSVCQNGIDRTASMIESRFALFMTNPDAKMPRHGSLNAALEWSYGMLTPEQRTIFRNLSVFVGPFTMDGIHNVAAEAEMDAGTVTAAAEALLAKSILYQETSAESLRYRILATTRAFGTSKLLTFGNGELVRRRHATYMTRYLTLSNAGAKGLSTGRVSEGLSCNISNIRAALEWCFSARGDTILGAQLAAASAHIFHVHWLSAEIRSWLTHALSSLDQKSTGMQLELDLRAGILMNTVEPENLHLIPAQLPAIIDLADKLGSNILRAEARAWDLMLMATLRPIDQTLELAQMIREITLLSEDYPTRLLGDWLLGLAYHLRGVLNAVKPLCSSAATLSFSSGSIYYSGAQHAAWIGAVGSLARTLWLLGQPEAALSVARGAISRLSGEMMDHRTVRKFFVPLFLWAGAFGDASKLIAEIYRESAHEVDFAFAQMYIGALNLCRGNSEQAVISLQEAYDKLPFTAERGMVATHLAEALVLQGQFAAARQAIALAFDASEKLGDTFFTPELYRVMGLVMTIAAPRETPKAEGWFLRAIACADQQGSQSFALRAATSLAQFYQARGFAAKGHAVLSEVFARFNEGFSTPDLIAARDLLDMLQDAFRLPARVAHIS